MKQTAIGTIEPSEDGSSKGMTSVFHSLNSTERTGAQVGILRGILDTTHDYLIEAKSATDGFEVHKPSVAEAAKTAELAFLQLRNIIDDMPRWTDHGGEADQEAKKLLEAETAKAKADAKLKTELARPFYMLRARILKTTTGKFAATNDTQTIAGFGDSPDEASRQFDAAFFNHQQLPPAAASTPKKTTKRKKK